MNTEVLAVIWDYDGTLVDTRQKNLNVTREIYNVVSGKSWEQVPALASLENYRQVNREVVNWRELYTRAFGLSIAQTDRAGDLWVEFQQADKTATPTYEGIAEVLQALDDLPHGVVSQNSSATIDEVLDRTGLAGHFQHVVGFEEVGYDNQKPAPDGLLLCLEKMSLTRDGLVFFIGDHEVDMQSAHNANHVLAARQQKPTFVTIGAMYDSGHNAEAWNFKPTYMAARAADILQIVKPGKHS